MDRQQEISEKWKNGTTIIDLARQYHHGPIHIRKQLIDYFGKDRYSVMVKLRKSNAGKKSKQRKGQMHESDPGL